MKATSVGSLLLLSALTACIDLEGAFTTCVDAGRCRVPVEDAGAPIPDAGYDGGPSCTASQNPRLRCDEPIELAVDGGIVSGSALSASKHGFIAAWVATTAEVREVHLDRTITRLVTGVPIASGRIAVDARDDHWVAAWASTGASHATCFGSGSDGGVDVPASGGGTLEDLSIATSSTGAVALAAISNRKAQHATSVAGCPTALAPLAVGYDVDGLGVVSTEGGFRYVVTDQTIANAGSIGLLSSIDGGVHLTWAGVTGRAPLTLTSVASTSGAVVLTSYLGDDSNGEFDLGIHGAWTNHSSTGMARALPIADPGWWNMGTCGEGCVALGVIARTTMGPATISFFTDDTSARSRGAWDAECDVPARTSGSSSISVAGFGGRLGVMIATRRTAKLYLCDLPPLAP